MGASPPLFHIRSRLTPVQPYQFPLPQYMPLNSIKQVRFCGEGGQTEGGINRIHLKVVPVGRPRRRCRAPVTDVTEVVDALARAIRKLRLRWNGVLDRVYVSGYVVQYPMHPCLKGRVGVVADHGERLSGFGRTLPRQRRRKVRAVARMYSGDGPAFRKCGACDSQPASLGPLGPACRILRLGRAARHNGCGEHNPCQRTNRAMESHYAQYWETRAHLK